MNIDDALATLATVDEKSLVQHHKTLTNYRADIKKQDDFAKAQIDFIEQTLQSNMKSREQTSQTLAGSPISLGTRTVVNLKSEFWPDFYNWIAAKIDKLRAEGKNDLTPAFGYLNKKITGKTILEEWEAARAALTPEELHAIAMQPDGASKFLPPGCAITTLTTISIKHPKV